MNLSDKDFERLSNEMPFDVLPYCAVIAGSNAQESEARFELEGKINNLYEKGYVLNGNTIHYTAVQNMGSLSQHVFVAVMTRKDG